MGGGIPDRWIPYNNLGSVIPGTRFIAFKVPLKEALCRNLPEKKLAFTPCNLLDQCPKLSLVIDLTNTKRYYDQKTFEDKSVLYEKIFCPGHVIPPKDIVRRFFQVVDAFLENHKEEQGLIGVHCTHGVNRTGYFICKYMIERLGMPAEAAINDFNTARGHRIERENYINDLLGKPAGPAGPAGQAAHSRQAQGGYGSYREWRNRPRPVPAPAQAAAGRGEGGSRRRAREAAADDDAPPAKRAERRREFRHERRGGAPEHGRTAMTNWREEARVGSPHHWQHPGPPPYGPPHGAPHGAPHGPPQGRPYGRPPGVPHRPPPFGATRGHPHGPPQGRAHHGPPHDPPQGRPHQGRHQGPPHGPPQGGWQGSRGRPERSRSRGPSRKSRPPVGDRGPGPLD